ncbi:phylloplanin-like [Arachis stenosperma]|uniref:phylloplanin-like n=1 Tax=Arachis stenosperma TaxID=217475 RepID=UPI0025ABE33F|nr:phylloplanin-like [Arachis stenosperma]
MAMKIVVMLSLLVVVAMAIPKAKAQLGILNDLLGSANIQGTVLCTLNLKDNVDDNGDGAPAFSNAQVQLMCGGKVLSNATTNGAGKFSMKMDSVDSLVYDLSSMLSGCNLMVPTPLSDCNSNLPSVGSLISTLRFLGITNSVANITPSGFHFVPS